MDYISNSLDKPRGTKKSPFVKQHTKIRTHYFSQFRRSIRLSETTVMTMPTSNYFPLAKMTKRFIWCTKRRNLSYDERENIQVQTFWSWKQKNTFWNIIFVLDKKFPSTNRRSRKCRNLLKLIDKFFLSWIRNPLRWYVHTIFTLRNSKLLEIHIIVHLSITHS